jgi:hypothetical protein
VLPPSSSLRLPRRQLALTGLTGAALLLTGCTSHRASAPQLPAQAPPNPDTRLAARALGAERTMVARVEATVHRHAVLHKELRETLAVHRTHVHLLAGAVGGDATTGGGTGRARIPSSASAAVAALAQSERQLEAAHTATAVTADSGAFARVLAGMAAAAAQQAVLLDRPPTVRPAGPGS